ncbi:MAG: DUF2130 domain-containing protein, partial [Chthoniobacterales bacterium]|nr:DUF2130 domain-containing protein [Chthoniobacterales bacterium]
RAALDAREKRLLEQIAQRETALQANLAAREKQLADQRAALEQQAAQLEAIVRQRLDTERAILLQKATAEAQEKLSLQIKDLEAQLASEKKRRIDAEELELNLRQQQRKLEEAIQRQELELSRRLDEERQKIAEAARQQAIEAERLKLAEKEKTIADLQKKIDELQQRATQGSVQLQGETLEITLEAELRAAFPFDEIKEIKKGQRGGDCLQIIRTNQGFVCGSILWEAKRAKNWSSDWTEKLKENQREAKADLAVIVSTVLPPSLRGIGQMDGVWICELPFAVGLAAALRHGILAAAVQRVQQTNAADKARFLYDYLCSNEFRQRIENLVETFIALKAQLDTERRSFERVWQEREKQINRAISSLAQLYGGIQGIAGRDSLPAIPQLELPSSSNQPNQTNLLPSANNPSLP